MTALFKTYMLTFQRRSAGCFI